MFGTVISVVNNYCSVSCGVIAAADPGFPKRRGRQPIDWLNFPKNFIKMKEIGRSASLTSPPLDLPMC